MKLYKNSPFMLFIITLLLYIGYNTYSFIDCYYNFSGPCDTILGSANTWLELFKSELIFTSVLTCPILITNFFIFIKDYFKFKQKNGLSKKEVKF